ncbi:hypothetical protein SBA3_300009 [Candidatus Sulfopaludibacter sp. SbA3]|nr:hypothetical protein SBA3_300009 [Candidatus Sulfopaludibacter sp. SbA3]
MEAAQHVQIQQPRHNLFDILRLVVVARIHQHFRARAGIAGELQRHAPVGDIGVVERRLEGLVLHQHALIAGELPVGGAQAIHEPLAAMTDILRAGIIGPIGEPQRKVAASQPLGDFHAIQKVSERRRADCRIGIAQRPVLVDLILKHVRVDGPGAQPMRGGKRVHLGRVVRAMGQVPQNVQRHGGAHARHGMHLACVAELLLHRAGSRRLRKLAKTRSRIGESPRGQFNLESVQCLYNSIGSFFVHLIMPSPLFSMFPALDAKGQTIIRRLRWFCNVELTHPVRRNGSYTFGGVYLNFQPIACRCAALRLRLDVAQ